MDDDKRDENDGCRERKRRVRGGMRLMEYRRKLVAEHIERVINYL